MQNYDQHILEVLESPAKKTSEYGIKAESVLHKLKYFHLTNNYGLDTMHDMSEGVIMMELKLVLHQLVKQNAITVDLLNKRLLRVLPFIVSDLLSDMESNDI